MSLLRTSRILSSARGQLQIVPPPYRALNTAATDLLHSRAQGRRRTRRPLRPPTGWLFGVKPGEKPEKEGWENVFFYGFFGSVAFGVVGYWFKPDTR